MRYFPACARLRVFAFLVALPMTTAAQSKNSPATDAPGWGSEWSKPATRQQEIIQKITASLAAHDTRKALELCEQLFPLLPDSPVPYAVRGATRAQVGQYDPALADLDHAENLACLHHLDLIATRVCAARALVHARTKNYGAAANDLYAALKINDNDREALNSLAWLRAVTADAAYRNGPESVRLARKVVSLPDQGRLYRENDTLAAAYAESNDFRRAVETEKRALKMADKEIKVPAKLQQFQKDATARLQLYEQHQPYRSTTLYPP